MAILQKDVMQPFQPDDVQIGLYRDQKHAHIGKPSGLQLASVIRDADAKQAHE